MQEQKKRQRPSGDTHSEFGEEEANDAQTKRGEIDVQAKMKDLAKKLAEANKILLGYGGMCCDKCGSPCHPSGGCRLHPICSEGTHPCPC